MNKGGHLLVGIGTGLVVLVILKLIAHFFNIIPDLQLINILFYCGVIIIYSLLPDIDHKSGTITWWFLGLGIAGLFVAKYLDNNILFIYSAGLLAFTFIAAQFMSHRGFIHTILFGALISVPLYFLVDINCAIIGFTCFWSHLWADDIPWKFI